MLFKTELEKIKPGTVIKELMPDTLENDKAKIRRCTTTEEIDEQMDLLLLELKNLKKDKLENGRDISGDIEDLKIKLEVAKETKLKIMASLENGIILR